MIVVSGEIRLAPESVEAGVAAANKMAAATRDEKGCVTYGFWRSTEDEGLFRVFEEWESEEALARHFQTPHMADFGKALGALDVVSMDVKKYGVDSVGPVTG